MFLLLVPVVEMVVAYLIRISWTPETPLENQLVATSVASCWARHIALTILHGKVFFGFTALAFEGCAAMVEGFTIAAARPVFIMDRNGEQD